MVRAALQIEAAEMALLRIVHASTLPDPGELARQIANGSVSVSGPAAAATPAPAQRTNEFAAVMALLEERGHHALYFRLHSNARLVSAAPGELAFSGSRPVSADVLTELAQVLKAETGRAWKINMVDAPGEPTLKESADAADEAARQAILGTPIVEAARAAFPDAELIDWPKRSVS